MQSLDGKAVADGGILGCDFAGTVVQVGSEVTKLKVGDIVAGLIWGGEFRSGRVVLLGLPILIYSQERLLVREPIVATRSSTRRYHSRSQRRCHSKRLLHSLWLRPRRGSPCSRETAWQSHVALAPPQMFLSGEQAVRKQRGLLGSLADIVQLV